jgi:hypothetical protein
VHDNGVECAEALLAKVRDCSAAELVDEEVDPAVALTRLRSAALMTRAIRRRYVEVRIALGEPLEMVAARKLVDGYSKAAGTDGYPRVAHVHVEEERTRVGIVVCRVRLRLEPREAVGPSVTTPDLEHAAEWLEKWWKTRQRDTVRRIRPEKVRGWRASVEEWRADIRERFRDKSEVTGGHLSGEVVERRQFGSRGVGYVVVRGGRYIVALTEYRLNAPVRGDVVEVNFQRERKDERLQEAGGRSL